MKICFYLPTFNRSKVLQDCLVTAFNNTEIKPNETWIIDDGSSPEIKRSILELSLNNTIPINLIIHSMNMGIGYSFERIYNLMRQDDDLDIACIIESDYIWRKNWLEDVLKVFDSSPHTLAIAGSDHPDMYNREKTDITFVDIMKECFGEDLKARDNLYKPFYLDNIKVQGVSNSCGCMIIHWKRLKSAIQNLTENNIIPYNDYWNRLDRAFNKNITHDTRKNASDGWMSSTISKYGEMYMINNNIDIKNNFSMLSICDYSISQHICGGGVNGTIAPEGSTFIVSPTWKDEYLYTNPRS